jgi:hypothetical protein
MGSGMISWKANRSPTVAISTCEAELYGGASGAQELMWLRKLQENLQLKQTQPTLWCDNQATILMTKNPICSARSKHTEARYFFLRELVAQRALSVQFIQGTENKADIFTKPLSKDKHWSQLKALGLTSAPRGCVWE